MHVFIFTWTQRFNVRFERLKTASVVPQVAHDLTDGGGFTWTDFCSGDSQKRLAASSKERGELRGDWIER